MKSIVELLSKIDQDIESCMFYGEYTKHDLRLKEKLSDLFVWQEIETLCWVIGLDILPIWNRICAKYPHLGDITV